MSSVAITLRPNGSMTLPKKMRAKYSTIHYIAMEVDEGVLLKPVREDIEYYEENDGTVGLHFPHGIQAGKLADMFEEAGEKLEKEKQVTKRKKPSRKLKYG